MYVDSDLKTDINGYKFNANNGLYKLIVVDTANSLTYLDTGEHYITVTLLNNEVLNTDSFYIKQVPITPNTGIIELSNAKIYPNPATDYIVAPGSYYEVFDTSGQFIKEGRIERQIDVRDLSNGTYYIIIDKLYITRFNKE